MYFFHTCTFCSRKTAGSCFHAALRLGLCRICRCLNCTTAVRRQPHENILHTIPCACAAQALADTFFTVAVRLFGQTFGQSPIWYCRSLLSYLLLQKLFDPVLAAIFTAAIDHTVINAVSTLIFTIHDIISHAIDRATHDDLLYRLKVIHHHLLPSVSRMNCFVSSSESLHAKRCASFFSFQKSVSYAPPSHH